MNGGEKADACVKRILPCVVDAVTRELDDTEKILEQLVEAVAERIVRATVEDLDEWGFCSYDDFHRSTCEFRDNGKCDTCGEYRSAHRLVFACHYEDDTEESVPASTLNPGPCAECIAREADLKRREEIASKPCAECEVHRKERQEMMGRISDNIHRRMLDAMRGKREVDAPRWAAAELLAKPGGDLPLGEWRRDAERWADEWLALRASETSQAEIGIYLERFKILIKLLDPLA